ncbi:unnamed protein product [Sphagnum balticum]
MLGELLAFETHIEALADGLPAYLILAAVNVGAYGMSPRVALGTGTPDANTEGGAPPSAEAVAPRIALLLGGSHLKTQALLRGAASVTVIGNGLLNFVTGEGAAIYTLEEHVDEIALLEGIVVGYNREAEFRIELERGEALRQCSLRVTEDNLRITHFNSNASIKLPYSLGEPVLTYSLQDGVRVALSFGQRAEP